MEPGERLRAARKARRYSVEQVAARMDIAPSTVRGHENGQNQLRGEKVEAYARVLEVEPAWIMYGTGDGPDDAPIAIRRGADIDRPRARRRPTSTLATIEVPEYDVRLSAGGGSLIEAENQTGIWSFSRRYIVDELRLNPRNLAVVEVQGDSMYPTLHPGDRVLVDHSDTNPALPGVYAIWDSNATVVKRVERVPASDPPMIVLISDNRNHHEYRVPAEMVNVIGRVVWFARRM